MIRPDRRRRFAALLAVIVTIATMTTGLPAAAAAAACSAWTGTYYANQTLTGTAAVTRCDADINFTWGAASPAAAVPADHFSVRWTRTVTLGAGAYTWSATADDGIRVLVDGAVVLDGWRDQGATSYTTQTTPGAGSHQIVVEYYDNAYDALAQFSYAPASNLVGNGNLATGTGMPTCFFDGSWGAGTRTGAVGTDVPAGATGRSYTLTVSSYSSGDAKIMPSDAANCAPTVDAAKSYTLGVSYRSTVPANALVVFTQAADGGWSFWRTLATLPATTGWSSPSYTVAGLPAGTTRLSFGVAAIGTGVLSTTGYQLAAASAGPGLDVTGRWTVASVQLPNRTIHSTLLRDGRILLIAGSGNDANNFAAGTFTTHVWDPVTNQMTQIPTPEDMFCAGHVTLADGRVLIQGGTKDFPGVNGATTFTGLRSSYIFDPATNAFTRINDAQEGHWYPTLTKLGNGDVWMAGGLGEDQNSVSVKTEIFDFSQIRWLAYGQMTQSWQYWGEYPHMFLMQDGRLFYSGGHTFGNQRAGTGASIYDISAGTVGDVPGLTDKDLRDQAGSVLLPPAQAQRFLIAGGGHIDAGAAPTASTAIIDLSVANPAYQAGPTMPGPGRQYVNLTNLFDRTVLASNGATGNRTDDIFSASIYDPASNTWSSTTPADPIGRNYHSSAQLLPDGRVVVMGSNPLDGSFEMRISIYEPPYLFRGTRPTINAAPTQAAYGTTINLGVTGTVASASLTAPSSATHQMDSNARLVDLPITGTGANRIATVPSNSNLLPPGPYMLTVLDSSGVPSVARWITVGAGGTSGLRAATEAATSPTTATGAASAPRSTGLAAAATRSYLVNRTPTTNEKAANVGKLRQATGVRSQVISRAQGLAAAASVVTESSRTAGCTKEYGAGRACLPLISPGGARMGGMQMDWTCAEVRSVLPNGIALSKAGNDPQRLDRNHDGVGCGPGD